MAVGKVVALFIVSKYELHTLLCEIRSIVCIVYLLGFHCLYFFLKFCQMGVREKGCFSIS